ncbi:hypothetical protein [Peribacillus butanolivorans]|uniref:hypothetical protein n=1 Tax=Peribacillus butanolivorans TaxID=421767 RepID=UPI00382568E3
MHLDVNFYIPFLSPQLLLLTSIVSIAIGLCLTILGLIRIKIYKKVRYRWYVLFSVL